MSNPKTKLELTRVGKHTDFQLEPRILIEKPELSNNPSGSENILIHWDNLLALKALEQEFSGKVKCIYIDPPYNTGNAFEHYEDGIEHSIRLTLMRQRLVLLSNLLSEDWVIRVTLDDNEFAYCKVMMDEVFGRDNFLWTTIWQHSLQSKWYPGKFSLHHNYNLCYRKSPKFQIFSLQRTDEHNKNYSNPDNDPRWLRRSWDVRNSLVRKNLMYDITTPSGKIISYPEKGRRFSKETFQKELDEWKIIFSKDETRIIRKIYLADQDGRVPETIWFANEVWTTREANSEIKELFPNDIFWTPKPELLIHRILEVSSKPWDLVLDSFLGSGTTCAVAHKMWRKWIGIELWDHAYTHAKVRMDKVIEWEQGGISKLVEWKWWGGYKFYELWPSVLIKDQYDNYIINPEFDSNMLIQSLCKIENFTYKAYIDTTKHGYSTEKDFIHVTTRHITQEIINDIVNDTLKNGETLLIVAKTFAHDLTLPDTIQIKKIPPEILGKCSYDKSDYNLPVTAQEIDDQDTEDLE
jgi:adenine-specific DNA-methyltransferase